MKTKKWIVGLVVVSLHVACYAEAIQKSIIASADTFIRSYSAYTNYGNSDLTGDPDLLSVSGSTAVNSLGQQRGVIDSFIRFNMSSLVAEVDAHYGDHNWVVMNATLTLTEIGNPGYSMFNMGVGSYEVRWLVADNWVEGTGKLSSPSTLGLTWNNRLSYVGPSDVSLATGTNNQADGLLTLQLQLSQAFVDDIRAGSDVSLLITAASPSIGCTFYARKTNGPTITLTLDQDAPVPEPATLVLLGLGTCALVGSRIRRLRSA